MVRSEANTATISDNLEYMQRWGYAEVRGAVDPDVCDAVREHVWISTDEAFKRGRSDLFGNIQEQDNRWDLKLDLCRPVVDALNCFGKSCGPVLEGFVGSSNLKIVELAAISSDPGAKAQAVHADTMHGITRFLQSDIDLGVGVSATEYDGDEDAAEDLGAIVSAVASDTAIICSALLALQDISEDMGPTHVWPGTNTVEHHATLWGTAVADKLDIPSADVAFKVPHRKMTLKKGDLVVYDSRTMHCGGANMSQSSRRSVMVISIMGPGIRPDGTTWSILPSVKNRLRLQQFPLAASLATAPANSAGNVILPECNNTAPTAADEEACGKPIPPLEEWVSAVQCVTCRQWRPVSVEDAPRFANMDRGFFCKAAGFSCMQPQVYSQQQVDDWLS